MLIEEIYHKNPLTISKKSTFYAAVKLLLHRRYNGLIVLDDNENVAGVFSIQDAAAAAVPRQFKNNPSMASAMYKKGFFSDTVEKIKNKPVEQFMRTDYTEVGLKSNILAVTADFLANDIYIVPVIEEGKLIGVVTRTEIKHALAKELGLESHDVVD